jgi:hypothetical protein
MRDACGARLHTCSSLPFGTLLLKRVTVSSVEKGMDHDAATAMNEFYK